MAAAESGLAELHEEPEGTKLIFSSESRPDVIAPPPALEQVSVRVPGRELKLDAASQADAAERLGQVPCVGSEETCPLSTPTVVFRFSLANVVGLEATIQMDVLYFFQPNQVKARRKTYRLHLARDKAGRWSVVRSDVVALI